MNEVYLRLSSISLQQAEREENMSNCSSTIGDILEYKDLSAWRVTIPDLKARKDYFVFVIEVQRIDVAAKTSEFLQHCFFLWLFLHFNPSHRQRR